MARNGAPRDSLGQFLPSTNGHSVAIPTPHYPAPPRGLLPRHRRSWGEFWQSPLAEGMTDTDVPALSRLWAMRNQYDRLIAEAGKAGPVTGSEGQPVSHPALRRAEALLGAIARLEARFGLHPRARRRAADSKRQETLGQVNDELDREFEENPPDPLEDPRLGIVLGFDPRDNLADPALHKLLGHDPRDGADHRADWLRYWHGPDAARRRREIAELGNRTGGDPRSWPAWSAEVAAAPGLDEEARN